MVSPLGVVPKKTQGEFRLIHHLSWPEGGSVNDFIAQENSAVQFASLDIAMALIRQVGVGALLAKCDVTFAVRLLLIGAALEAARLGLSVDEVRLLGCVAGPVMVAFPVWIVEHSFVKWAAKYAEKRP
ncbi:hypothetical protein NDU88_002428 [Pleurodeles waltl]|uniref:Uncharacterized protein n=1 Tax=Pleurodeles waltl TaxID=8319 RepID=A0AAV7Q9B5_PLEWA|nr:hypothetical protein NDU88_002428 [Pleurodeles waltl]